MGKEYSKEYLKKELFDKVKKAFKDFNEGDQERQNAAYSTKKSINNPLLDKLSMDLKEVLGESAPSYSSHNLKDIFLDASKLSFEEDRIVYLKLFCERVDEIVEQRIKEKKSVDKDKGRSQEGKETSITKKARGDEKTNLYLAFLKKWIYQILLLLAIGIILTAIFYRNNNNVDTINDIPRPEIVESCVFKKDNLDRYKVLIVPFEEQLVLNDVYKNIEPEIEDRLNTLNKIDNLNLDIHYCEVFIYDKQITDGDEHDYYTRVMKEYNADFIIYGFSRDIYDSEIKDLTEIKINYQSRFNNELLIENLDYGIQNNFELATLTDISNGFLLEDIEYTIYINRVIDLLQEGENKKAEEYLNLIADVGNGRSDYTKIRAWMHIIKNQYSEALLYAKELLDIDSTPIEMSYSYSINGSIKVKLQDGTALYDFQRAIEIDPTIYDSYHGLATYFWHLEGDYQEAIFNFNKAISIVESDYYRSLLYDQKAKMQSDYGNYQDALESINFAIEYSNQPFLKYNKAGYLRYLNKNTEAITLLNNSFEEGNSNYNFLVYLSLGYNYRIIKKMDLSLENYEKAREIYPCNKEAFDGIFFNHYNNKEYQLAEDMINQCLFINPDNYFLLNHKRNICIERNQFSKVDIVSKKMDELSPTVYFDHNEKGELIKINPIFDSLSNKPRTHYSILIKGTDTISKALLKNRYGSSLN